MGFDIEVTGIDEARRQIDDIVKNIGEDAIGQWFDRVAKTANDLCRDSKVEFVRGDKKGEVGHMKTPDQKSIECTIRAIDKIISEVPEPANTMLRDYKKDLESQLKNNQ